MPESPDPRCCVLESPLDEEQAVALGAQLKALADPARLRLVSLIATAPTGEVCACVLPGVLGRSQPTVSHHLSQLTGAGILEREQRGKWAWFRLSAPRLAAIRAALGEGADHHHVARPIVLFLCRDDAGRSQLAAAQMRQLAGDRIEVRSAGSAPADRVDPVAVAVMREIGIDIADAAPRRVTDDLVRSADVVVSIDGEGVGPIHPGSRLVEWDLPDPTESDADGARRVRDEIRRRVTGLLDELTPSCCG